MRGKVDSTAKGCRASIQAAWRAIEAHKASVDDLAKMYVEGFHFLNDAVSMFWTCDESPIGMCVFRLDDQGRKQNCRYCNGPVERK